MSIYAYAIVFQFLSSWQTDYCHLHGYHNAFSSHWGDGCSDDILGTKYNWQIDLDEKISRNVDAK